MAPLFPVVIPIQESAIRPYTTSKAHSSSHSVRKKFGTPDCPFFRGCHVGLRVPTNCFEVVQNGARGCGTKQRGPAPATSIAGSKYAFEPIEVSPRLPADQPRVRPSARGTCSFAGDSCSSEGDPGTSPGASCGSARRPRSRVCGPRGCACGPRNLAGGPRGS
eukprot:1189255-Pyramimonas_sp.AAC.1